MFGPIQVLEQFFATVSGVVGSVYEGLYGWMARGLAVLIEWLWRTLDSATAPKLSEPWFARDLFGPLSLLAVGVTVAMMLASAIQAGWSGRPEQIVDAVRRGVWSVVATALTITVTETMLNLVDEASASIWAYARPDTQGLLDGVIRVMAGSWSHGVGFLGILILLLMYLALLGLAVALQVRMALIYLVAGLAPLVFASSVFPIFRQSAHKIIHLGVALVFSKLAIVIALTISVKMMANATDIPTTGDELTDASNGLGVLLAGVVCFAIAAVTPMVLYRLMPTVEGAIVGTGIAGGWGRSATSGMYAMNSAKSMAGGVGRQLATRPIPTGGGQGGGGSGGVSPPSTFTSTSSAGSNGAAAGGSAAGSGASAGAGAAGGASAGAASAGAAAGPAAAIALPVMAGASAVSKVAGQVRGTAEASSDPAVGQEPNRSGSDR